MIFVIILLISLLTGAIIYTSTRAAKFLPDGRFEKKTRFFIGLGTVSALFALFLIIFGWMNAIVIILHVAIIFLLADGIGFIIKKVRKKEAKRYFTGIFAIIFSVIYLTYGYISAHRVLRTEYEIDSDGRDLKIVAFSDSHIGAIITPESLSANIERINGEDADVVFIIGDFIDDETSFDDMKKSCAALGQIKAKYGVYFVFGNHDAGYYSSIRGYGKEDLIESLTENGVNVLQDETFNIKDDIYVIGRKDKSSERKDIKDLKSELPEGCYTVVLDHQPGDYENEAEAGVDLVLSGHTHGGQLIPIRKFGEIFKVNDRTYGYEARGKSNFIVSSGIGDWALDFKTGCVSEYVVVELK